MKLEMCKEDAGENTIYRLTISRLDLANVKFDELDRILMDECSAEKDDVTISDQLLALEMITRRVEQSSKKPTEKTNVNSKT